MSSAAGEIEARAERELEALVAVSSPNGDRAGAEEAAAVATALLPARSQVQRLPCSTPGYADDLLAIVAGTGSRRLLLVGHLDTVIEHGMHQPLRREGERLVGSGTLDMKGGVVLALGVLGALATTPAAYAEVALLLVCDEEWRTVAFQHAERLTGYDACLCFEAGQRAANGEDQVIVQRKAAGTLRVEAEGVSSHSGSAPDAGRNALLALAVAAQRLATLHDPDGPAQLSVVPTILRSGEALNVVPASGELLCDLRADDASAFDPVIAAVPEEVAGATLSGRLIRCWPGMDTRAATAALLVEAARRLDQPIGGARRGGASDASHFAQHIPLTLDGLGPLGAGAHAPEEHVLAASLGSRARVALAIVAALLGID